MSLSDKPLAPLHVAVVGAGIAGLSCATALCREGHRVTVFEKSRGPSGRMSTRRGADWACDHGAQYFTARDPRFRAEVARWEAAGAAALWTPRLAVLGGAARDGEERKQGAVERFVGTPRMTAPAAYLAQCFGGSLVLRTEMTVDRLERCASGWRLGVIEQPEQLGPPGDFDAVALALPSPQALSLLEGPAPALAEVAAGAPMQPCWAVMLRFDQPLALPLDAAFVNDGPLRWVARDSSKPGRGGPETWLLHASAVWSEAHLEWEADTVAAKLIDSFVALGGARPQAWSAHRWRYAIRSRNERSGKAIDHGGGDVECVWQAADGLGLCGDWLYGGAVEGAWLSGLALARRIVDSPVRRV